MASFLIVYDRAHGSLRRLEQFDDQRSALRERFKLERQNKTDEDLEVVVLVAESEAALRKTHARYFETFGNLMRSMHTRPA